MSKAIKKTPILASTKTCTGCFACVDVCQHKAICIDMHTDGHRYVVINENNCVCCGICEKTCPIVSDLKYNQSETSFFYAAWALDRERRKKSASGGVFYAMATAVIQQKGVVFGAKIEAPCKVYHQDIETIDQLSSLQGSKYTHSNAAENYKKALNYLKERRLVLFSGTGCQIAGLLSFLDKKIYSGQLITIDLICGGIPSELLINKFIESAPYKVKQILSFRTKETGWKPQGFCYNLKVEDENGEVHDYTHKNNLITSGFSSELTNRYSCYNCRFVGEKRMSDFTIGDYWGCQQYTNEQQDGISLIIVHSNKAYSFLNSLHDSLFFEKTDKKIALSHNHRLIQGYDIRQYFPERKYLSLFANKLNNNTFSKIYANNFPNTSPWMLLKIIRKILTFVFKINKRITDF